MRDFDVVRAENREHGDRKFKIGGESFEFQAYSSPELYAATWTADSDMAWLAAADAFIESVLVPTDKKKWVKVRKTSADAPLSFADVRDVMDHVLEVTSGRPTAQPNGSSGTSSAPTTTSKETSASRVAAASAVTTSGDS